MSKEPHMRRLNRELEGRELDQAVAFALGIQDGPFARPKEGFYFEPSKLWEHGGPLIERERINIRQEISCFKTGKFMDLWEANINCYEVASGLLMGYVKATGPTQLVAAMRAYLEKVLGETVWDESRTDGFLSHDDVLGTPPLLLGEMVAYASIHNFVKVSRSLDREFCEGVVLQEREKPWFISLVRDKIDLGKWKVEDLFGKPIEEASQ